MSDHDKLSQELGISQDDAAAIELNEKKLEQVAGGHHDSSIIIISTIITENGSTSPNE